MISKTVIRNNFSKYAKSYDSYSCIQNICAKKLIAAINEDNFTSILDVGCGTGSFTELLYEKFPKANIKAIDLSDKMLDIAKSKMHNNGIDFKTMDAESLNLNEKFDLISSNATFQWFEDLNEAILNYRYMLAEQGMIAFSIFGPDTFYELSNCLKELSSKDVQISAANFINKNKLYEIMKSFFEKTEIKEQIYKKHYSSLVDLLKTIKYTGTNGKGFDKAIWTRGKIKRLEDIYVEKYKGIVGTYQVFYCKARV